MAAQVELVKTGELVEEGKVLVVLMVRTKLHLRDVEDLAPRGTSQGQTLGLEPWQSQMWEMRVGMARGSQVVEVLQEWEEFLNSAEARAKNRSLGTLTFKGQWRAGSPGMDLGRCHCRIT